MLPATSSFMPSGTPGSLPRRSANTRSLCLASVPLGSTSNTRMWPRRAAPGIGEVDGAVGLDDDVIGPVEPAPLEAVRQHGEAAVELAPGDPPAVVLAREQAALLIAGEPIGAVGRLQVDGHALPGRVFHAPVVVNIGEQEVAALLPPQRSLGRPQRAAEARGQFLDRLASGDDLVERGIELLDLLLRLRRGAADPDGHAACRRRYRQHVPARNAVSDAHG